MPFNNNMCTCLTEYPIYFKDRKIPRNNRYGGGSPVMSPGCPLEGRPRENFIYSPQNDYNIIICFIVIYTIKSDVKLKFPSSDIVPKIKPKSNNFCKSPFIDSGKFSRERGEIYYRAENSIPLSNVMKISDEFHITKKVGTGINVQN